MNKISDILTTEDEQIITTKGIYISDIHKQLQYFQKGFPFAKIVAPATIEFGITQMTDDQKNEYIATFEKAAKSEKIVKFVPASGAASRMFKALNAFMNSDEQTPTDKDVIAFFDKITEFAFYKELLEACKQKNIDIKNNPKKTLELLLTEQGLNYGKLPKALLLFHKYGDTERTAMEEHLVEAMNYGNETPTVHFTISKEHRQPFEQLIDSLKEEYGKNHNVQFNIETSEQKPHTDTIAVDMDNNPFRRQDGTILFRPGGHGALIENLNDIDADIVFVKNIDNVVHDRFKKETYEYKKALAGLLVDTRTKTYSYLHLLNNKPTQSQIDEIKKFIEQYFTVKLSDKFQNASLQEQAKLLFDKLNRPIRICGMVKNEGEPGGGPFFVEKDNNEITLQIVESAQIDLKDENTQEIFKKSTHFNPVDLILSLKDYQGKLFDLRKFIDPDSGFISEKSLDGKSLKALELPGLWNGAMYGWNTIFVEVPSGTFNPVKTVNDLLRPQHLEH